MREIYAMLNDINTEMTDFTRDELTEQEKRVLVSKVEQISRSQKATRKKGHRFGSVAACAVILVIFVIGINYHDTAYATAKNIAWQIGEFLGIEKSLQDYTTVLGTSQKDNGYTITLNEVILDQNQLVVSSLIKSDSNLTKMGVSEYAEVYVNGKRASVAGGGASKKVDDYSQESVMSYELEGVNTKGKLDIEIQYKDIVKDDKETKGKWYFQFEADGAKLAADTIRIPLSDSFVLPAGGKMTLTEYTINAVGERIYFKLEGWDYKKHPMYDLKLEGMDDLGNQVEFDLSYFKGKEKVGRLNRYIGPQGIKEGATSLTLTPYAVEMPKKSGKMSNNFVTIGEPFTIQIIKK